MEIFLGILMIIATVATFFGITGRVVCPRWVDIIAILVCIAVSVASYFVGLPLWITIVAAISAVANIVSFALSLDLCHFFWYIIFAILGLGGNISVIVGCFLNI